MILISDLDIIERTQPDGYLYSLGRVSHHTPKWNPFFSFIYFLFFRRISIRIRNNTKERIGFGEGEPPENIPVTLRPLNQSSNPRDPEKNCGNRFSGKNDETGKKEKEGRQPPVHPSILLTPIVIVQPFLVVFSSERRQQRTGAEIG